jgi:hypothetical protein
MSNRTAGDPGARFPVRYDEIIGLPPTKNRTNSGSCGFWRPKFCADYAIAATSASIVYGPPRICNLPRSTRWNTYIRAREPGDGELL